MNKVIGVMMQPVVNALELGKVSVNALGSVQFLSHFPATLKIRKVVG
jgi:hypothetical protein